MHVTVSLENDSTLDADDVREVLDSLEGCDVDQNQPTIDEHWETQFKLRHDEKTELLLFAYKGFDELIWFRIGGDYRDIVWLASMIAKQTGTLELYHESSEETPWCVVEPSTNGEQLASLIESLNPIESESVEIVIPDPVGPMDRIDKYEDPLEDWMEANDIGTVGDGGTSLMNGNIECVYFSAEVNNIDLFPVVAEKLRELGAPEGSKIHYIRGGYDVWNDK